MKIISRVGLTVCTLTIMAALTQRFEILPYRIAFAALLVGMLSSSLLAIFTSGVLLSQLIRKIRVDMELIPMILVCMLPPVIAIASAGLDGLRAPSITDITSDTAHPPAFRFIDANDGYRENSLVYPGDLVAEEQMRAYPDIQTVIVKLPARVAYRYAFRSARLLSWVVVGEDRSDFQFEATAKTPLLGFTNDVVVRVTPISRTVSALDIRSVSRFGRSDLGANARRIRHFFAAFDDQVKKVK